MYIVQVFILSKFGADVAFAEKNLESFQYFQFFQRRSV